MIFPLKIDKSDERIVKLTGDHLINYTNAVVDHVRVFTFAQYSYLPQGFSLFFPNIVVYSIYDVSLENIKREDLKGLNGLQLLSAQGNKISTLDEMTFVDLKELLDFEALSNIFL